MARPFLRKSSTPSKLLTEIFAGSKSPLKWSVEAGDFLVSPAIRETFSKMRQSHEGAGMMKLVQPLFLPGGIALTAVSANTASADDLADIMASGKLRVSIDLTSPPTGMLDQKLKPIGSAVETAQQLA
jgi:hypothetical protein